MKLPKAPPCSISTPPSGYPWGMGISRVQPASERSHATRSEASGRVNKNAAVAAAPRGEKKTARDRKKSWTVGFATGWRSPQAASYLLSRRDDVAVSYSGRRPLPAGLPSPGSVRPGAPTRRAGLFFSLSIVGAMCIVPRIRGSQACEASLHACDFYFLER